LDDNSSYIVSGGDDSYYEQETNPDEWIYAHMNDFVNYMENALDANHPYKDDLEDAYNNLKDRLPPATVMDELHAVWSYLYRKARDQNRDLKRFNEKDFFHSLDEWITSAYKLHAMDLKEGKDYRVVHKQIGDKPYLYAVILKEGLDQEGAQWSNGVHQLLHAKLAQSEKYKDQPIPFLFEHERKSLAISNNQRFIDFHLSHKGRLQGATGSTGSRTDVKLLRRQHNIDIYHIPTHKEVLRELREDIIAKDFNDFVNKTLKEINETAPNPKLIFCKDIETLSKLKTALAARINQPIEELTAKEAKNSDLMDKVVANAAKENAITLTTFAERGVDIKIIDKIKNTHKDLKLVVIDTNFVRERKQVQRQGRTARKGKEGIYRRILNNEDFKTEFGVDLPEAPKERKVLLKKLSRQLDQQNKQTIYQQQAYMNIVNVAQEYLKDILSQLTDPEGKKEFNRFRQRMLKKLEEKWQNCLVEHQNNIPAAAKAFTADAQRVLNLIHGQYEDESDSISLLQKLKEKHEKREAIIQTTGLKEESEILSRVKLSSAANIQANIFPLLRSSAYKRDRDQFYVSRSSEDDVTMYKLILEKISNTLMWYQNNEDLSRDRKSSAKKLSGDVINRLNNFKKLNSQHQGLALNGKSYWMILLNEFNSELKSTLNNDLNAEKSLLGRSRKGNSRYRFHLMNLKSYLFTVCPRQYFDDLLTKELSEIEQFVNFELQRKYFNQPKNAALNATMTNLHTAIQDCNHTLNAEKLLKISAVLNSIYADPMYKSEETDIRLLGNHFVYLSTLYAEHHATQAVTQALEIEVRHDLEKAFHKMPHFSAPKLEGFFSSKNYTLPPLVNTLPYSHIIKSIGDNRAKYYYAHWLEYVYNEVKENLKGFNVKFESDFANHPNQFKISFDTLNPKTHEAFQYTCTINIDTQRKKMNVFEVKCGQIDKDEAHIARPKQF
jgi:hypothetical protein